MKSSCPLCSDDLQNVFLRDPVAIARLSEEFACRGHVVLSSTSHVENVSDLPAGHATRFFDIYARTEAALLEIFDADRVLAVKLGLAVPHLHIHLYPVRSELTRQEVDRMLSRTTRVQPSPEQLHDWLDALRSHLKEE